MSDHPTLSDFLEGTFTEPPIEDDEARDRFTVDSDEKATWASRKLARYRGEVEALEQQAADEKARIDAWLSDATSGARHNVAWFESLLVAYAAKLHHDDPDGPKSRKFLGGRIGRRKLPDKAEVSDDAKFVAWAFDAGCGDLVASKPSLSAIKKDTGLRPADGHLVHVETGEVVPGLVWVEGVERYYAEVDK